MQPVFSATLRDTGMKYGSFAIHLLEYEKPLLISCTLYYNLTSFSHLLAFTYFNK